jgi:hypothetical protein
MENRPNGDTERGFAAIAMVPHFCGHRCQSIGLAIRALRLPVPAQALQVGYAVFVSRKLLIDFCDIHNRRPCSSRQDRGPFFQFNTINPTVNYDSTSMILTVF